MESIAICICTYNRYEGLRNLLQRLSIIDNPAELQISIIVIDNDSSGTASKIRSEFKEIHYFVENEIGVSFARNRAVIEAKKIDVDYIAFLDDDEIPNENWLVDMIMTIKKYDADIVAGPVIPVLPKELQVFLPFMTRKRHLTGTPIEYWGAGNILLRIGVFDRIGFFSVDYSERGGEDTQFSARCKRQDLQMVWSDSAIVFEPTDAKRANPKWLAKRAYNAGRIIANVERELDIGSPQRRIAIALVYLFSGMSIWPASLVIDRIFDKNYHLVSMIHIKKGLGMIKGSLNTK